jgi:hypothetical protein
MAERGGCVGQLKSDLVKVVRDVVL